MQHKLSPVPSFHMHLPPPTCCCAGGQRAPIIRTRHVSLSPTGRSWAAATTEGLLLYR